MPSKDCGSLLRRALQAVATGDTDAAAVLFRHDVHVWSPNVVICSRDELLEALGSADDALTDVVLTVDHLDVIGDKAIAEWHATAAFTDPLLVEEDVLIEPTGRQLALAGMSVAEFDGEQIRWLRNYFDDSAFLEQMLTGA
jgi:ketosteroid isomerase-like protein